MMVKLTGPGLAHQATGSIGEALTFSTWKGKSYLKKHRAPKQPRSPPQLAMRAIMAFLSGEWDQVSAADKATWLGIAEAAEISPFNAYQRENLSRWRRKLPPSTQYPPPLGGTGGALADWHANGLPLAINFSMNVTDLGAIWAIACFAVSANNVQPNWHHLRTLVPISGTGWFHQLLRNQTQGVHWFCLHRFFRTGRWYTPNVWRQATVTS